MQITIYSGFSKEINSTKQPSGGTVVTCTLKSDTSLLNPVFLLKNPDFSINYVQWGSRYYYVDDIVSVRNEGIELHCSVDAMASFKASIGGSTQYVVRSASAKSSHIIDRLYPVMPQALLSNITLDTIHSSFSGSTFVVGVAGSNGVAGISYFALTPSQFANLLTYLFSGSYLNAPAQEISFELQKELVNPMQYILSCQWFPFTITSSTQKTIEFGYWVSDVVGYVLTDTDSDKYKSFGQDFTIGNHSQHDILGSWVNCQPYTNLSLHCYSFGDMVLDASAFSLSSGRGYILIQVDVISGVGELRVYSKQFNTGSDNNVIARGTAQIGVPVQLSQVTQSLIQSAIGIGSSIGAIAQGNFIGILSGIGDAFSGILPTVEKSGAYGTRVAFREAPSIQIRRYGVVNTDNTRNGSPLMDSRVISSLSGYIVCENVDLDITGTPKEKNEIISFMQSGFYYE